MIWIKRHIDDNGNGIIETVVEQVTQRELDDLTDEHWRYPDLPGFEVLSDEEVQQILIDHRRK